MKLPEEQQLVKLKPRYIEVCNITHYRAHQATGFNAYIGRWPVHRLPSGLYHAGLGNPHPVSPQKCEWCGREHERKLSIVEFENDLKHQTGMQLNVRRLAMKTCRTEGTIHLWCHCSPLKCHGDVIAARLVELIPNLERI